MVFIAARKGPAAAGFSSLGARGKPAEQVAEAAGNSFLPFPDSRAAVDAHLGDQILPYLALAPGRSEILVQNVSSHLRTNLWVVNQFQLGRLFLEEGSGFGKLYTPSLAGGGRGVGDLRFTNNCVTNSENAPFSTFMPYQPFISPAS